MRVFDKKLHRIIGQIKYRPTLTSFDETALVASKLEKKFEEWGAPKHDDIHLYSPSEKKLLQVAFDNVLYANEGKEDVDELQEYLKIVFENLSVSKVRSVGCRNIQILESSFKFEELTEIIYRKFYSQEIKGISTDKPKETVFILDGNMNGFLNKVQIGPVRLEEGKKMFDSRFGEKSLEKIGDSNLYIDVDVHVLDGLTKTNTLSQLEEAVKENLRITKDYLDYISK